MAYGGRSSFVDAGRIILDTKVNMQMHGDPNGFDALTPPRGANRHSYARAAAFHLVPR